MSNSIEILVKHLDVSVIIDADSIELFENEFWCINTGYLFCASKKLFLHRMILGYSGNLRIDHINRNKLDNRKCNLRFCTTSQNIANRAKYKYRSDKPSKFKGVSWAKNNKKWVAQIRFRNKLYHLGYFIDEENAAKVYDINAKELFGEFACLNFQ